MRISRIQYKRNFCSSNIHRKKLFTESTQHVTTAKQRCAEQENLDLLNRTLIILYHNKSIWIYLTVESDCDDQAHKVATERRLLCCRCHNKRLLQVIWYLICHFLLVVLGTKPLSLTVSEIFNGECDAMVGMTLVRSLNKGQVHSFWYQSISHIRFPILLIVTFALGRTV